MSDEVFRAIAYLCVIAIAIMLFIAMIDDSVTF
jgi:hypothetical protein